MPTTTTHGANADCPDVQKGLATRCPGHPIEVSLPPQVASLGRHEWVRVTNADEQRFSCRCGAQLVLSYVRDADEVALIIAVGPGHHHHDEPTPEEGDRALPF